MFHYSVMQRLGLLNHKYYKVMELLCTNLVSNTYVRSVYEHLVVSSSFTRSGQREFLAIKGMKKCILGLVSGGFGTKS